MNIFDKSFFISCCTGIICQGLHSFLYSFLLCIPQQILCSTAETHAADFASLLEYSSVILGCFWLGLRQRVVQEGSLRARLSQCCLIRCTGWLMLQVEVLLCFPSNLTDAGGTLP